MSRPAITKQLEKRAVVLDQNNFQREVLDYDGAVMVLFDSTCPSTLEAERVNRNRDIVYLGLMDRFDDTRVNGLDLKFTYFDGCHFYGNPEGFFKRIGVNTTETHMYLDGIEIDRTKGGITSEKEISKLIRNMSYWIDYTLLGKRLPKDKDREVVLLYNGDLSWEEFPSSILNER